MIDTYVPLARDSLNQTLQKSKRPISSLGPSVHVGATTVIYHFKAIYIGTVGLILIKTPSLLLSVPTVSHRGFCEEG